MKSRLVSYISVRVTKEVRTEFFRKAHREDKDPSEVLRELIKHYLEKVK